MRSKRWVALSFVAGLALLLAPGPTAAGDILPPGGEPGQLGPAASVASKISYQGRLTDAGGNPLDGTYNLVFQLWDDPTAGSQVGSDIVRNAVSVNDGLFTVKLDMPAGSLQLDGRGLWLRIRVDSEWLVPRQELLPVPYALTLRPGAIISSAGPDTLHVWNTAGGFSVEAWSENNIALLGTNGPANGGPPSGMHGVHGIGAGVGVYGEGGHTGVYGSGDMDGVKGESEVHNGVRGLSTTGFGVSGESAEHHGVVGWTGSDSSGSFGVYGHTANAVGVRGESTHHNGIQAVSHSSEHAALAAGNEGSGPGLYAEGGPGAPAAILRGNVKIQSQTDPYPVVIELGEGLDYAEGFDVSAEGNVEPGTVLIIDPEHPGQLAVSSQAYDSRVAGIVAGGGGQGSGVRLGPQGFDHDVALAGRVYCNVDATYGAVEPGDLLTTSATPGFAMVVLDHAQAQGAILGKAMESLQIGQKGQILVLVTLQ